MVRKTGDKPENANADKENLNKEELISPRGHKRRLSEEISGTWSCKKSKVRVCTRGFRLQVNNSSKNGTGIRIKFQDVKKQSTVKISVKINS